MGVPLPLVAVVAVAENGVIGRNNDLPWRLRTDLRRFKAITLGKPLIVGRKNWEAIGRPLPGRDMIVLTRRPGYEAPGARVVHDWDAAISLAEAVARERGADEIVVGGGSDLFRLAMPSIARLRLTRVHARPDGDVLMPPWDEAAFRETFREAHPAGPDDEHPFTFIDLERARPDSPDAAGR